MKKFKYGTAGFRYLNEDIIAISEKIGVGLMSLEKSDFGVMITASHNTSEYNGVKIVNNLGLMLSTDEEKHLEEIVNLGEEELNTLKNKLNEKGLVKKVHFGKDTRSNCDEIIRLIILGMEKVGNVQVINEGYCHTPLLHYLSTGMRRDDYFKVRKTYLGSSIYVDCAGGVGDYIVKELNHPRLKSICGIGENELNVKCGSEYAIHQQLKPQGIENGAFGCSLDGDADRIVFWVVKDEKILVLDGDYIMSLWAIYFKKKYGECVVITTPYCNSACANFLERNGIEVIYTATGIKNLVTEAQKHDVSVYFEANGHGTAHIKKELGGIVLNQLIGDGIYNIITTIQILDELEMSVWNWLDLFEKKPVRQFSVPVKGWDLKVNEIGDKILSPKYLQDYFDYKMSEGCGKIFARPSGTEPIIRVYLEGNEELEKDIKVLFSYPP